MNTSCDKLVVMGIDDSPELSGQRKGDLIGLFLSKETAVGLIEKSRGNLELTDPNAYKVLLNLEEAYRKLHRAYSVDDTDEQFDAEENRNLRLDEAEAANVPSFLISYTKVRQLSDKDRIKTAETIISGEIRHAMSLKELFAFAVACGVDTSKPFS